MARTRTWSTTIPVDHTQIKLGPEKIRDVRTDIEERVDGILAGFVNTGATNGLLLARLLTVGTNYATNPGTGTAAAISLYGMTTGTLTELVLRNSSGHEMLMSYQGRLQVGKLANDQYMIAVGTGAGDVNVLKIDTVGSTYMFNPVKFASHPLAPNTAPSGADLQLLPYGALRNMFDSDVFVMQTAGAITIDIKTASISANYISSVIGASATKATSTAYQAESDGFVTVYFTCSGGDFSLIGYSDGNANPTTIKAKHWESNEGILGNDDHRSIMFPVIKNNYWKVTASGVTTGVITWTPLGI